MIVFADLMFALAEDDYIDAISSIQNHVRLTLSLKPAASADVKAHILHSPDMCICLFMRDIYISNVIVCTSNMQLYTPRCLHFDDIHYIIIHTYSMCIYI